MLHYFGFNRKIKLIELYNYETIMSLFCSTNCQFVLYEMQSHRNRLYIIILKNGIMLRESNIKEGHYKLLLCQVFFVGRVERSETRQIMANTTRVFVHAHLRLIWTSIDLRLSCRVSLRSTRPTI